jgi:RNA polymerase sigma-70 factor (ECF subfamily)
MPTPADPWTRLLVLAQGGNRTALDLLLKEVRPWLLARLKRQAPRGADVEDAVQETLLRLYLKLDRFDPQRGSARSWITRLARNCRCDLGRKAFRRRMAPLGDWEGGSEREDPARLWQNAEERARVRLAVETLPATEQAALRLRYSDDASYKEVGATLGMALSTAVARIARSQQVLRERLTAG